MKKISVIIVAYKNGEILKNALDSIQRFNDIGADLEVVIVDNSPEDHRIKQFVVESEIENYQYIVGKNNGFGYGNNRGAEIASGEILAFINPDVYLIEPIFYDIYHMFLSDEKLMMLGCQLLDRNGNKSFSYFFDYESSIIQKMLTKIYNRFGFFDQRRMFTSGCNMFIRREAFEKAGGFDEQIFMYNEEADIKKRIIEAIPDCRIAFDKEHSIIHLGGSVEFSENRFRLLKNSLIYFGKKHHLDFRKKFRYEYRIDKLKCMVFKNSDSDKYLEAKKEIECFEKYYNEYIS